MMTTREIRAAVHSGRWPAGSDVDETLVDLCDELDARNGEIRTLKARIAALESGPQTRGSYAALSELARVYGDED